MTFLIQFILRWDSVFLSILDISDNLIASEFFSVDISKTSFVFLILHPTHDFRVKKEPLYSIYKTDKDKAITFRLKAPAKIYVHSADELSSYDSRFQFVYELMHKMDFLITMKETLTADDAKQLSMNQRKCSFPGEIVLSHHANDSYSLSACLKQCRMTRALKSCKCVPPFYVGRIEKNGNRLCEFKDFKCLSENSQNITDYNGCHHCKLNCMSTVFETDKFTNKSVAPF